MVRRSGDVSNKKILDKKPSGYAGVGENRGSQRKNVRYEPKRGIVCKIFTLGSANFGQGQGAMTLKSIGGYPYFEDGRIGPIKLIVRRPFLKSSILVFFKTF